MKNIPASPDPRRQEDRLHRILHPGASNPGATPEIANRITVWVLLIGVVLASYAFYTRRPSFSYNELDHLDFTAALPSSVNFPFAVASSDEKVIRHSGASEAEYAEGPDDRQETIRRFVESLDVSSYLIRKHESRLTVSGQIFLVGDTVDAGLGLVFAGFDKSGQFLVFKGPDGKYYPRAVSSL